MQPQLRSGVQQSTASPISFDAAARSLIDRVNAHLALRTEVAQMKAWMVEAAWQHIVEVKRSNAVVACESLLRKAHLAEEAMLNADPASLASAQPLLASAQSVLSDVTTLQDKLDSLLGEVTGLEAQLTEGLQRARTLQEELTDALRHAGRTAMAAAGVKADDPEGQMEGLFATLFGARSELVASGDIVYAEKVRLQAFIVELYALSGMPSKDPDAVLSKLGPDGHGLTRVAIEQMFVTKYGIKAVDAAFAAVDSVGEINLLLTASSPQGYAGSKQQQWSSSVAIGVDPDDASAGGGGGGYARQHARIMNSNNADDIETQIAQDLNSVNCNPRDCYYCCRIGLIGGICCVVLLSVLFPTYYFIYVPQNGPL
jgi:hypothetical protein